MFPAKILHYHEPLGETGIAAPEFIRDETIVNAQTSLAWCAAALLWSLLSGCAPEGPDKAEGGNQSFVLCWEYYEDTLRRQQCYEIADDQGRKAVSLWLRRNANPVARPESLPSVTVFPRKDLWVFEGDKLRKHYRLWFHFPEGTISPSIPLAQLLQRSWPENVSPAQFEDLKQIFMELGTAKMDFAPPETPRGEVREDLELAEPKVPDGGTWILWLDRYRLDKSTRYKVDSSEGREQIAAWLRRNGNAIRTLESLQSFPPGASLPRRQLFWFGGTTKMYLRIICRSLVLQDGQIEADQRHQESVEVISGEEFDSLKGIFETCGQIVPSGAEDQYREPGRTRVRLF